MTVQKKILFLLVLCIVVLPAEVLGQAKQTSAASSPFCTQDNALEMIRQQAALSKSFNSTQRITALIRVADLLWPYQQDKARAAFTEAFDFAVETEKENAELPRRPQSVVLRMQVPDQRHVVIRAIAKRDSLWAKTLVQQVVRLDTDPFNKALVGNRLLDSAIELLPTNKNAALEFARASLNYPASFTLTHFMYKLANDNQQDADQFYVQALAAYRDKPMREFLYLQTYPFGLHESLNTAVFLFHPGIPASFVPNRSLQRRFMQVLLMRTQQVLETPLEEGDGYRDPSGTWFPITVHILQGLVRLEPEVRESLPDLLPALREAREKLLVSLSVENQKLILQPGREASVKPTGTFADEIDSALKESDVYERNEQIASAVLGSQKEKLADVVQAIDKVSDSDLRAHLTEWVYFDRATTTIKDRQFDEAERLTSKVEGLEERAFLHVELAKALLNRDDARARELIEVALGEAKKAGATMFAARTLLTAANLYAKIDLSRSVEVLTDAINFINRIEAPDFVSDGQALEKTPVRLGQGGRYNGEYRFRFYMPGMDPESTFREMGKIDFDMSLSQSSTLKDKFQRTLSTLALADVCLQQAGQQRPKRKSARP